MSPEAINAAIEQLHKDAICVVWRESEDEQYQAGPTETWEGVLFGPAEDFGTDTLPGAIKAQHLRRRRKRPIHVGCADSNSAAAGGDTCQIVQWQERTIRGHQRPRERQPSSTFS